MKLIISLVLITILTISNQAQVADTFYVASWNVENFFDNVDDPNKEDSEFTKKGSKEWTDDRLNDKTKNLAYVINFMNNGRGPDIIGFMEVEHKYLLEKLADNYLAHRNYKVVGYESGDIRGIDNYLMYDANKFELLEYNKIPVVFFNSSYVTRDILHTLLKFNGELIDLFVNHWPSRRGGEERSQPRRVNAASTLRRYVDSLATVREESNFIIMGDFNDEPNNYSLAKILSANKIGENNSLLYNLAWDSFERGIGTHFYDKEFNMLDQIIISSDLIDGKNVEFLEESFEIVSDDSFIFKEGNNAGAIIPTFSDGKFMNGYSDHLPVAAKFYLKKGN